LRNVLPEPQQGNALFFSRLTQCRGFSSAIRGVNVIARAIEKYSGPRNLDQAIS
jgi:hypothetical protein